MRQPSPDLVSSPADSLAELEHALSLARAGQLGEANRVIRVFREKGSFGITVDASLRAMLVEGLIFYFESLDFPKARDRLRRALALAEATAGVSDETVSRIAAWLGHICFNCVAYEDAANAITKAIKRGGLNDPASAIRILLTTADSLAIADDLSRASALYEYARKLALKIGDRLSVAAVLHNRATIALSLVRYARFVEHSVHATGSSLLLEVKSAENLESFLRMDTVLFPFEVWRARLLILDQKFSDAVVELEKALGGSGLTSSPIIQIPLYGDLAYCFHHMSREDEATRIVLDALEKINDVQVYSDDKAVFYSIASDVLGEDDLGGEIGRVQEGLRVSIEETARERGLIRSCMGPIVELLSDSFPSR